MAEDKNYWVSLKKAARGHGDKKAAKAIRLVKAYLSRRVEEYKLDESVNLLLWSGGGGRIPKKIQLHLSRDKSDEPWKVSARVTERGLPAAGGGKPGADEVGEKGEQ